MKTESVLPSFFYLYVLSHKGLQTRKYQRMKLSVSFRPSQRRGWQTDRLFFFLCLFLAKGVEGVGVRMSALCLGAGGGVGG